MRLTFFVNGTYRLMDRQPGDAAAAGGLRTDPAGQPHLVASGSDDAAEMPDRRRDQPQRQIPEERPTASTPDPICGPRTANTTPTVDAVAADLGYTITTLWSGSLSDSTVIAEDYILKMADQYFSHRPS